MDSRARRWAAAVLVVGALAGGGAAWWMQAHRLLPPPAATGAAVPSPQRSPLPPLPALSSPEARVLAEWVRESGDAQGRPFLIVDKREATLLAFGPDGALQGRTPVLLGAAAGDHTVPGVGDKPLAQVLPEEKTTPAGRFQGEFGLNTQGEDILWVDYDAAVSLHRVRATNPAERRLERLASPGAADNRISWGCINVPAAFYDSQVLPLRQQHTAPVVYVLPETRSLREVFPQLPPA